MARSGMNTRFRSPASVGFFGKALGVVFLLGTMLAASGCILSEDCDPATDPECVPKPPPEVNRDAQTGTVYQTYHYVLVLDQESTNTGGMELDAVALVKDGSATNIYADTFHEYIQGQGVATTQDANRALGPPGGDGGTCTSGGNSSVYLGGTGGSIVVSFGNKQKIEEGDLIKVITCGGGPGQFGIYVGVQEKASSPHWVTCTKSASVTHECLVPPLPKLRK